MNTYVGKLNKIKTKPILIAAVSVALLSMITPITVTGQATENTASSVLEEVVVTARKREESLQDTPISITVFSAENLSAMHVSSIDQIGDMAPNVVFDSTTPLSGSANSTSITIRGIGLKDYTLVSEPGVGIYVDDVYLTHSIGNVLDVVDIERIEVLRGPQGTLYGRNTIGGAVRIVTKKPHDEFEGAVQLTGGSYNRLDVKGHLNVPITDNFYARVSGLSQAWDGFINTPNLQGGTGTGDKDTTTLAGVFRWLPASGLKVDINLNYMRDRTQRQAGLLLDAQSVNSTDPTQFGGFGNNLVVPAGSPLSAFWGDHWLPPNDQTDFSNVDNGHYLDAWGAGINIEWNLNSFVVKSISSFRALKTEYTTDLDHSPITVVDNDSYVNLDAWSQEIQILGDAFNERLTWIAGVYYFYENGVNDDFVRFGQFFDLASGGEVTTEDIAIFGQGTYDLTEKAELTVGLRWTKDEKDFDIDAAHQLITASPLNILPVGFRFMPVGNNEVSVKELDPYVNLTYHWSDNLMTYMSYSEGFKGGGFVQRNGPAAAGVDKSYGPEFATVYEIGAKWASDNRRMNVSATGFFTDYTDLQLNVILGVASTTRNAGKAEIIGFEFEVGMIPVDALRLSAGLGYMDGEYKELTQEATSAGLSLTDNIPGVPNWQANGSISYEIATGFGTITPRLDLSYSAKQDNDALNFQLLKRDSYTIVNVAIDFRDVTDRWTLSLFGRNLTEDQYIVAGFNGNEYVDGVISRPAEWGVSIGYSF